MGIFGKKPAAPATPAKPAAPSAGAQSGTAAAAMAAGKAAAAAAAAKEAAKPKPEPVDVKAIIEAKVKAKGIKLNWDVSIVDLLKALDLDSSPDARKALAAKLNYTGTDPDGSAEKNIWLHKAVMTALENNGGNVPAWFK
ncbi:MAG: DUF3597 domain-containing protein [Treponema sp.]|nr:DUF3597 domain-containing protein [Treponema sp.]MCL2251308.1 DUF3597 domain-containing protein [Treponema sp.]